MRAVLWHDDRGYRAGTRAAQALGAALGGAGWTVRFLAPRGAAAACLLADGADVADLPTGGVWRTAWRLRQAAATHHADVAVVLSDEAHRVAATARRLGMRAALLRRVAPATRPDVPTGAARGTTWLFASERDRRAATLPDGGDHAAIAAPPAPPPGPSAAADGETITVIADAEAHRRVPPVLRALAPLALRHPAMRVVIVGAEAPDALRVHAAALGLQGAVEWRPPTEPPVAAVRDAALVWIVAGADAAAEAALAACSARRPLLADARSWVAREFPDAAALTVDAEEGARAAAAIAALLADAPRRSAMAAAAWAAAAPWTIEGFEAAIHAAAAQAAGVAREVA